MKTTRNTRSHSRSNGHRRNGKPKTHGTGESLISKSLVDTIMRTNLLAQKFQQEVLQEKLSSMTGKAEKSMTITTTKNPFIVSHCFPNSLLCKPCGRSTFTLTLARIENKCFIQIRCINCGNIGSLELGNWKETEISSPIPDTTVGGVRTQKEMEVPAGFDQTYK